MMRHPLSLRRRTIAWKGCSGRTTTEVLLVFLLLMLLGMTIIVLSISGFRAYEAMNDDRTAESEIRTAVAYVSMKIRQSDEIGMFRLDESPSGEGRALVLSEIIRSETYETWIWFERNKLVEAIVPKGEAVSYDVSADVVGLEEFDISEDGGLVNVRAVSLGAGDRPLALEQKLDIRSGGDSR